MDRPFKTATQIIREGYDSEAALAFLGDFFAEEKEKQVRLMLGCPVESLPIRRAMLKYVTDLEKLMKQKVEIGIKYATEQP